MSFSHSEFAAFVAANELHDDAEFVGAAYKWGSDYALAMADLERDAEDLLTAATEAFAGEFNSDAEYAESVAGDLFSEQLDAIQAAAQPSGGFLFTYSIDWEDVALCMQNTEGLDYAEFDGYYFRAAR